MKLFGKSNVAHEVEFHMSEKKQGYTLRKEKVRQKHIEMIKQFFPKAKSILCIGARHDAEIKTFVKAGFKAVGIDVCNEGKLLKKIDAHQMDKHFGENEYDVIYSSHSLEHMHDPITVLKNIRKIAKMGLFFVLPTDGAAKVSEDHACVYDIMLQTKHIGSPEELLKKPELLEDFKELQPFEVVYYKQRKKKESQLDGEITAAFRFKK